MIRHKGTGKWLANKSRGYSYNRPTIAWSETGGKIFKTLKGVKDFLQSNTTYNNANRQLIRDGRKDWQVYQLASGKFIDTATNLSKAKSLDQYKVDSIWIPYEPPKELDRFEFIDA